MIGGDESTLVLRPHGTSFGDCLLRRAASLGRMESAALLIRFGARIDFPPTVLERWGCLGTPLVNACEVGHADMVRLLLESGAEMNAWTRCCQFSSHLWDPTTESDVHIEMDWTALHAACAWGSLEAPGCWNKDLMHQSPEAPPGAESTLMH